MIVFEFPTTQPRFPLNTPKSSLTRLNQSGNLGGSSMGKRGSRGTNDSSYWCGALGFEIAPETDPEILQSLNMGTHKKVYTPNFGRPPHNPVYNPLYGVLILAHLWGSLTKQHGPVGGEVHLSVGRPAHQEGQHLRQGLSVLSFGLRTWGLGLRAWGVGFRVHAGFGV